jgi:hypothetical protein
LLDEKHAHTLATRFKECAEVLRHCPEIGSDENPILTRGKGQHFGVGDSFQSGLMCRKKIDRRFTPETPSDDGIVEAGIRQEADHPSASSRDSLATHTLKGHPDL